MNDWTELRAWLPVLATVGGWAVVNRQNNQRERRKEERALVDGAKKLVIEVAAKARATMCATKREEASELDIKCMLDQLEIELMRLPGYERSTALINAMGNLADAATAGDFESAAWRPRLASDPEPKTLMTTRNMLLQQLEAEFCSRYLR